MNQEFENRPDLSEAAQNLSGVVSKLGKYSSAELGFVYGRLPSTDQALLRQLLESAEASHSQVAREHRLADLEVRAGQSLAEYYIDGKGQQDMAQASIEAYRGAGTLSELINN